MYVVLFDAAVSNIRRNEVYMIYLKLIQSHNKQLQVMNYCRYTQLLITASILGPL